MAIVGIETLIYGVDDVELCADFFEDFGLPLVTREATKASFQLDEGSNVIIQSRDEVACPESAIVGTGVQKVIWGVDTKKNLEELVENVSQDVPVRRDEDGSAHFLTPCGLPMGLRLFQKKPVVTAPDPLNSPGRVNRLNRPRKWRTRARPKVINHVVFTVKDYDASFVFFRDRLNFRLSDTQRNFGIYMRCDGSSNHHSLFLLNANLNLPGLDGEVRFHHVNYGVEDLDEIMVGANYMQRRGWAKSELGLGRHRIDSALFFYLPCPTGGEAEYGADGDALDDSWIPRDWVEPTFGYVSFVHELPEFLEVEPAWEVKYVEGAVPDGKPMEKRLSRISESVRSRRESR